MHRPEWQAKWRSSKIDRIVARHPGCTQHFALRLENVLLERRDALVDGASLAPVDDVTVIALHVVLLRVAFISGNGDNQGSISPRPD